MKPSFGFWPTFLVTFVIVAWVQFLLAIWALWVGGHESSPSLIGDIALAVFLPAFFIGGFVSQVVSHPIMIPVFWLLNAALYSFVVMGIIRAVRYFQDKRAV